MVHSTSAVGTRVAAATMVLATVAAPSLTVTPVAAGSHTGTVMVRAGITVVHPDASADVPAIPGADADVSTEVIPSLTLSYFFTRNLAVELFCCVAKHEAEGKGTIDGVDLGDFWIFPPALTLQYHFDPVSGFKPYVGAGIQYIAFFDEGKAGPQLAGGTIELDDAFGFTLQAGVDYELGRGWYLNADVKKTWLSTDASWTGTAVTAEVDVDPWTFTVGLGYRFDLFTRHAEPLK
jgi:outer membrane protein